MVSVPKYYTQKKNGWSTLSCKRKWIGQPGARSPACAGSGEGSDHFGSYIRSLSLHFCKRLFPGLEPMTSWSQGNSFTAAPGLPFYIPYQTKCNKNKGSGRVGQRTNVLTSLATQLEQQQPSLLVPSKLEHDRILDMLFSLIQTKQIQLLHYNSSNYFLGLTNFQMAAFPFLKLPTAWEPKHNV